MTEVFFCTVPIPREGRRATWRREAIERWHTQPGIRVKWLWPRGLKVTPEEFQRERRIYADRKAQGEIYVLADDDCYLVTPLRDGLRVMERHPEFGILSFWPDPHEIHPWRPEDYEPFEDEDVLEHVDVGGIRICRRDVVLRWPPKTGKGYDREHCEAIRLAGLRVGYLKRCRMLHLGHEESTVWV